MKKKMGMLLLCAILLATVFTFTACGNNASAFVGTYKTNFVEGYNTSNLSFILNVASDKTFELKKFEESNEQWTSTGTWAGNTSKDNFGIICLITASGRNYSNNYGDYEITEYFTLTQLDNGCIIASPGIVTCFGLTAGAIIIFERI